MKNNSILKIILYEIFVIKKFSKIPTIFFVWLNACFSICLDSKMLFNFIADALDNITPAMLVCYTV